MTADEGPDRGRLWSGPVVDGPGTAAGGAGPWLAADDDPAGDGRAGAADGGRAASAGLLQGTVAAAGARGRQGLELIANAVRGVGAALRVSALAGLAAAVVITVIWDPAFDLRWWKALVLLVVLALPAGEVLLHRFVLVRTWGDAARLERRVRTVSAGVTGGADDFARRMSALRDARSRTTRSGLGAARSAYGLRDVAGAVPELAGILLLPLKKGVLGLTAACTALCWALLVVGVPVAVLVGIGAALAR